MCQGQISFKKIQTHPSFNACSCYMKVSKGPNQKQQRKSGNTIFPIMRSIGVFLRRSRAANSAVSSVWDPPGVVLQEELESVQKRAARFVTGNYDYETGSMTGILGQLKWESLKKRRKDNRLILLYKGLKGKASVPTDDLIPKTRRCRNQHSMAFQTPIANTDVYKGSFFPQTIRDWNALPDSLISSAEDAEDCVAKFTSLVRARD